MKKLLLFFLLFSSAYLKAQLDSLGHLKYDVPLNDIWGYEDKEGNEYALVGLTTGLSIVDVTNPKLAKELYRASGPKSAWRDIKVYQDFAYVTNEEDSGLRIYDLSGLPNHRLISYKNFSGEFGKEFTKAHNLFIDSNGIAYVAGTNRGNDMILFDLKTDPWQPKEVGSFSENYIHDIYVRNDTAFASAIVDGEFQILDVTNKKRIQILSTHPTGYNQTHNAWLTNDGNYLFTTDEVDGSSVEVFDVRDKFNPEKVESFKISQFGGETPHNVCVKDSILFIAYYKSGLVAVDCSKPDNLVELSKFDTEKLSEGSGFSGAWGVYPFFNSGHILVSDINNGLYILELNPMKARYLEGTVSDSSTGFPLNDVKVQVLGDEKFFSTSFTGEYGLGFNKGGLVKIVFSSFGYVSDTIQINLLEDSVLTRDISLKKKKVGDLLVSILSFNGHFIDSAVVSIQQVGLMKEYLTNELGSVKITDLPIGEYDVFVGKWGFKNACGFIEVKEVETKMILSLETGYYDDFSSRQGWTVSSPEGIPIWERTEPKASFDSNDGLQYDPSEDASEVGCNKKAFCTGINPFRYSSGSTVNYTNYLVSPEVIIPNGFIDAFISVKRWVAFQKNSEDSLKLGVILGKDTTYLVSVSVNDKQRDWTAVGFNLSSAATLERKFKFIAQISDDLDPWNLVDAAIDDFEINFIKGDGNFTECIHAENFFWRSLCGIKSYIVLNGLGQVVLQGVCNEFDFNALNAGIYIIKLEGFKPQKIVIDE